MRTLTRPAALLAVTSALALGTTGSAAADTNKSQQTSSISGATAPLLAHAVAPRPDSGQSSQQSMDKAHTTNWTVIDYAGRVSESNRANDIAMVRTPQSEEDLESDRQRAQEIAAS
ncbi:hypothetical protein [Streptomyces longispororuber]|uniref:hypothetical protein n=1 Tax=Streptomyces longispororuber TaxID=68230 RepID=UPI00167D64ED|nr:hypothetical protein [Streptomyces longispororuber]